jgi:hypothetical protein
MKKQAYRDGSSFRILRQRARQGIGFWTATGAIGVVAIAIAVGVAAMALQQAGGTLQSSGRTSEGFAALPEVANPHPDANRIFEDSLQQRDVMKRMTELNELRQKEMTSDTQRLVALANALKTEMDKGHEGALYVDEVRKVEEIEKLAHGVQVKMRTTVNN